MPPALRLRCKQMGRWLWLAHRAATLRFFVITPSAANVSVSGRILTADGRGISRARVTLTDAWGNTRTAITSPFGYYKFDEVPVGETCIVSVAHKRYIFNPDTQVLNVFEDLSGVDFTADN